MLTHDARAITVDVFPGSPLRRATRLFRPSVGARVAARLRRGSLDRALTEGADPAASPLIAARATQLCGASTRARIADGLERLARSPDRPRNRARITPWAAAMLANRSALLELAGMLRARGPLYARGVAPLAIIVTDGAGPAYTDRHGDVLARQLQLARAGLTG